MAVTYRLSIKSVDRQFGHLKAVAKLDAWHAATREFRKAFAIQLSALEAGSGAIGDVMDFLRHTYDTQSEAVAVFEEYLPSGRKQKFRATWLQHCYDAEDPSNTDNLQQSGLDHDSLLFLHYSSEFNLSDPSFGRRDAIERIRRLMAFSRDAEPVGRGCATAWRHVPFTINVKRLVPMRSSNPNPDDHVLDPWMKLLGIRWLLIGIAIAALLLGIYISIVFQEWSWLNRFAGFVLVCGLFLAMAPIFSNGIYRSQSSAGVLSGLNSDNTPIVTTIEDRKVGNNVVLGIIITIIGTLTSAFGDVIAGYIYGF